MDIYIELDRIKKGMELVDNRIDKNGNPMDDESFDKHMDYLQKLMREVSEEGHKIGIDWAAWFSVDKER